jgi:predicted transcriptional regulator
MSTKPTAAQILRSWDKTRTLLSKTSLWLTLLRIADAGPEGITLTKLTHRNATLPYRDTLKKFVKAGVIEAKQTGSTMGCAARHHTRYHITEKGSAFLRIQHHTTPAPVPA